MRRRTVLFFAACSLQPGLVSFVAPVAVTDPRPATPRTLEKQDRKKGRNINKGGGCNDLAAKLTDLQAAKDQGLLTDIEFDHAKKGVLSSFSGGGVGGGGGETTTTVSERRSAPLQPREGRSMEHGYDAFRETQYRKNDRKKANRTEHHGDGGHFRERPALKSRLSGRLDVDGVANNHSTSCGENVILISPGRSATDSIGLTVTQSSRLRYCDGQKEYFKNSKPTMAKLRYCVERFGGEKGGVFIHVKPEHITFSESEMPLLQRGLNSSRNLRPPKDALRTPEEFFRGAKAAGFNVVVTNFRDNQLARAVSSFEIKAGEFGSRSFTQRANERFVDLDLSHSFRSLKASYDRSVAAASAEGLVKLNLNFASVVSEQHGVFACWQGARGLPHLCRGTSGRDIGIIPYSFGAHAGPDIVFYVRMCSRVADDCVAGARCATCAVRRKRWLALRSARPSIARSARATCRTRWARRRRSRTAWDRCGTHAHCTRKHTPCFIQLFPRERGVIFSHVNALGSC